MKKRIRKLTTRGGEGNTISQTIDKGGGGYEGNGDKERCTCCFAFIGVQNTFPQGEGTLWYPA